MAAPGRLLLLVESDLVLPAAAVEEGCGEGDGPGAEAAVDDRRLLRLRVVRPDAGEEEGAVEGLRPRLTELLRLRTVGRRCVEIWLLEERAAGEQEWVCLWNEEEEEEAEHEKKQEHRDRKRSRRAAALFTREDGKTRRRARIRVVTAARTEHAGDPSGDVGVLALPGRFFAGDVVEVQGVEIPTCGKDNAGNAGTGMTLWDGAVLLARFAQWNGTGLDGTLFGVERQQLGHVVEVGCGVGLAGLATATMFARLRAAEDCGSAGDLPHFTLTDLPHVLSDVTRGNLEALRLRVRQALSHAALPPIALAPLDWTRPFAEQRDSLPISAVGAVTECTQLHIVLAADVVWVPELIQPLCTTLHALCDALARLSAPAAVVVAMVHQTRSLSGDHQLLRGMLQHGFRLRLWLRGKRDADAVEEDNHCGEGGARTLREQYNDTLHGWPTASPGVVEMAVQPPRPSEPAAAVSPHANEVPLRIETDQILQILPPAFHLWLWEFAGSLA